jgi:hypothetical protein
VRTTTPNDLSSDHSTLDAMIWFGPVLRKRFSGLKSLRGGQYYQSRIALKSNSEVSSSAGASLRVPWRSIR